MALITRVSRLFQADLHAVLDRIEEPQVLLKQALREMEEQVAADERRLKLMSRELQHNEARSREVARRVAQAEEELDVCFAAGKHDLARSVVKRKLENERLLVEINKRHAHMREQTAELQQQLNQNREQMEAVRQQAELLSTQEQGPDTQEQIPFGDIVVPDEEVEVAFLREQQQRSGS